MRKKIVKKLKRQRCWSCTMRVFSLFSFLSWRGYALKMKLTSPRRTSLPGLSGTDPCTG
jgi:hypothetical protein